MSHYDNNKEVYKARRIAHKLRLRLRIVELKQFPCVDCGVSYPPYVMQFDHVRGTKDFDIAHAPTKGVSLHRLDLEVAKCDLVCANCHAVRTHDRLVDN